MPDSPPWLRMLCCATSASSERQLTTCPLNSQDGTLRSTWGAIVGMRNIVVHEYFRVETAMLAGILASELDNE